MLNEANLPASFWALAVSAYVHVWNRLPTAPLPATTPYTEWFKRKPDISHFRVFGCTAYVYIQRDKRKSLQPHMEKCIFVGYPSGYKGWQFYNPVTKKFIISERAIFDERSFPGLSRTSPVDLTVVGGHMNVPDFFFFFFFFNSRPCARHLLRGARTQPAATLLVTSVLQLD